MEQLRFVLCPMLALLAWPALGSDAGTTAANFLKLGVGPRAIAMGDAQVGLANDVYATYWNPAGLAQLQNREAGFAQTLYLEDIQTQYAAYAHPHPTLGTLAGSVTYLHVGRFEGYDAAGQPTGQVGASDAAFGLSYARPLLQNRRMRSQLCLGATGKYIQETLDDVTARAYAMDAGLLYSPGRRFGERWEGMKVGLAMRHLGSAMKFDQESFDLPRVMAAGLSWTGVWLGESLTMALDAQKSNDSQLTMGAGLELWTLHLLVVRMGYSSQGDLGNGLRLGGGLRFKTIQVDYAFASAGDLGQTHRIGLNFRFGITPPDPLVLAHNWYELGLKEYRRGRYTEALVDFNKALEMDPSHPDALSKMKDTHEKLKTISPL